MIANIAQDDNLVTVTLDDGTVVKHWYHVCDACTSVDTWIDGPPDPQNLTGDPCRRNVRGFAWNGTGGRTMLAGVTTLTTILDKETA